MQVNRLLKLHHYSALSSTYIYAWQSPARSGVRPRSYRLVGSCEMYVTPPRTFGDEVEERYSMKVCSLRVLLDVVYVNALYTLKNIYFISVEDVASQLASFKLQCIQYIIILLEPNKHVKPLKKTYNKISQMAP